RDTPAFGPSAEMVEGVTKMATDVVRAGKIPIVVGGEHSLAPAVVRAFPKDIGVIGIDAHLDFRDQYLEDRWSHACSARRIADHVGVEHVVYMGVRSYSAEEREDLERLGLTYVSAYDIHDRGIRAATERALKSVNRDKIYLTIDMDGVDPAYAPAVGNPEPFGLAPLQVKNVIARLAPDLVGMDLNEVSPAAHAHPKATQEQRIRSSSQPVARDITARHIVCDAPGERPNVYVHSVPSRPSRCTWATDGAARSTKSMRSDTKSPGPTSQRCG